MYFFFKSNLSKDIFTLWSTVAYISKTNITTDMKNIINNNIMENIKCDSILYIRKNKNNSNKLKYIKFDS